MGTHLTQAQCPSKPEEITLMRSKPYQAAVGSLNHAAVMTHSDISKAVQTVAQFASNPGKHHWDAVIHIICYLKTTRNWVLTLGENLHLWNSLVIVMLTMPTLQIMITPFQDMQWYLAKAASPGHPSTALSTGEAEYYAVTHAGHKVIWLRQLLTEIGFAPHIGTTLHIDNTSSICMIETSDQVTNCTKHINIAYHWIHEEVQKQNIVPGYVPSEQNISDIFTKGFHAPHHKELASALGMDLRANAS
jgi:hypothetical protein